MAATALLTLLTSLASPTNLLWLMADDLGAGEPSFTSPGRMRTPNIDRLAAEGMQFSAAYAGYTVCAPSRATFFTGRNSGRLAGAPGDFPLLPQLLKEAGYDTAAFGKSAPMDATQQVSTLKWGLPTTRGFTDYAGQTSQLYCHNMYPEEWTDGNQTAALPLNARGDKSRAHCMAHPAKFNYTTDLFADAAVAWLRGRSTRAAAALRPFFLYVSFTVPHAGGWSSAPKAEEQGAPVPHAMGYESHTHWPQVERDHAASVTYLDARIGSLLDTLQECGLERSTAVFFASDNGAQQSLMTQSAAATARGHCPQRPLPRALSAKSLSAPHCVRVCACVCACATGAHNEGGHDVSFFTSTGGLRGFKRSFYEGGVRSPSVLRWPGVTPAGSTSSVPWAFWDALPTLLEMAGSAAPVNATIDGRSIVPALRGEPMEPPAYMYWTWRGAVGEDASPPADGAEPSAPTAAAPGYAARVREWKAVVHSCADEVRQQPSLRDAMELYNLTADPFEQSDVAAAHPLITYEIKSLLARQDLSCECFQC